MKKWIMLAIIFVSFIVMGYVDAVCQPPYFVKSAVKIALFVGLPVAFFIAYRTKPRFLKPQAKGIWLALALGGALYVLIVGAYLLFQNVFDFSGITSSLTGDIGVTKENFIFVALYISFVNSFLEEFFFRGFAYLQLKEALSRRLAFTVSASTFALYHVAMMIGWYTWPLFLLTMVGLFVGGAIFNLLNDRYQNIYTSWIVHMFANFGINTVGLMLFGIL